MGRTGGFRIPFPSKEIASVEDLIYLLYMLGALPKLPISVVVIPHEDLHTFSLKYMPSRQKDEHVL